MNKTTLIEQLARYIYDSQNEQQDYFNFCDENSRDPNGYAVNTDHIYAVAFLVLEELENIHRR